MTRKITLGAARIKAGQQGVLQLGNLDSKRDWGYAPEYVEAMWQLMQAETPRDFILATGKPCSVREFALAAFQELGIELVFESTGVGEFARRKDTEEVVLSVDARYYRPVDAANLIGNASLAAELLGWKPKVVGADVARLMAKSDASLLASKVRD